MHFPCLGQENELELVVTVLGRKKLIGHNEDMKDSRMEIEPSPVVHYPILMASTGIYDI